MKKTTKAILAVLTAAVMASGSFAVLPVSAATVQSEPAGTESGITGDCKWTLDDEGTLIISGNGEMGRYGDLEAEAPWKYDVKSAVIEEGVTNIGSWAFCGCTNLTDVVVADTVTSIDDSAFGGCENLTEINLPDKLSTIEYSAFAGCTSLTEITIPESVEYLGGSAFSGCESLKSVVIPSSVKEIGLQVFSDCNSLTGLVVDADNPFYDSRDNCNAIIETATNTLLQGIHTTVIPNSVEEIETYAFSGCAGLKKITINHGIKKISFGAFENCENLTSVYISDTVTDISNNSFSNARSKLNEIVIDPNNAVYDSRNNCNAIIETADNKLIFGCQSTIIPDSVTSIGCQAFAFNSELTRMTIPGSVNLIEDGAFYDCDSLTEVVMEEGVTIIAENAFSDCDNLFSITLPKSVTNISSDSFGWIRDEVEKHMIYCYKDSYAHSFALENNVPFFLLDAYLSGVTGDLDLDGRLTIDDATIMQKSLAEYVGVPAASHSSVQKLGDVDGDGKFTIGDVTALQRELAEFDVEPVQELILNESTLKLGVGETVALTTSFNNNEGLFFQSSNPSAAVTDDKGTVTATGVGTAIINVSDNYGQSAECTVTVGKAVSNISLNQQALILGVGETYTLKATVAADEVTYQSGFVAENPEIAGVGANGKVTAKAVGTTKVSYQAFNGKKASCTVTIKKAPTKVILNKTSLLLQPGEQFDLNSAVPDGEASRSRVFSTSNAGVASVEAAGGMVTAVAEGTAIIYCTAYNGVKESCKVTVCKAPSSVSASPVMLAMGKGEIYTLHALYDGSKTSYGATFASDNTSVATVNADTGVITAKNVGYVVITVKSFNGKTAKCYLTVRSAPSKVAFANTRVTLLKGEKFPFYLHEVNTTEALASASYSTNNPDVATVSSTGVVTAHKAGISTITGTTYNGKKATCTVTVIDSAGSNIKTTTAAVGLLKDATWKSGSIKIIPKGAKVTVYGVSDDKRWMKVQYGANCGWIYNKALGTASNYSEITLKTLSAVADDLIFDKNVNKRAIYDYVYNDITYRNSDNDTTESLCVEAFTYGRGSCYHHAALINYLYNRIGLETITVVGVDDLTGSDHAWCITKTVDGWRHVDAQKIITWAGTFDNTNQYFVKDSLLKNYFTWDRIKYPAAV